MASCHTPKPGVSRVNTVEQSTDGLDWDSTESSEKLVIDLRSGSAATTTQTRTSATETTPLSDAQRDALLARLPELGGAKEEAFARRETSKPPPKTGDVVPVPFPADSASAAPEVDEAGPLRIVRFAPEGDVSIAPHVSVTFSQPMVPVSSQAIVAETVPVTLSPDVAGEWVWLGTKTLQFKPEIACRWRQSTPSP